MSGSNEHARISNAREEELVNSDSFWRPMMRRGAQAIRVPQGREEILSLLLNVASDLCKTQTSTQGCTLKQEPAAPAAPAVTILERRLSPTDDLERLRTAHQKELQEKFEQYHIQMEQSIERRRTIEEEQRAMVEDWVRARQEEDRELHETRSRELKDASECYAEIQRRQSEQLIYLERSMTSMSIQSQNQTRWQCWQQYCAKMQAELAVLQNARNMKRTVSQFYARLDGICCTNCFIPVKFQEEYFGTITNLQDHTSAFVNGLQFVATVGLANLFSVSAACAIGRYIATIRSTF